MKTRMTALCQVMPADWLEAISRMRYRQACSLLGLLLRPVAVAACALGAWRFGVDTGWTNRFFVASGFLSHWQVWFAFAISAEVYAYILGRTPRTATAAC